MYEYLSSSNRLAAEVRGVLGFSRTYQEPTAMRYDNKVSDWLCSKGVT